MKLLKKADMCQAHSYMKCKRVENQIGLSERRERLEGQWETFPINGNGKHFHPKNANIREVSTHNSNPSSSLHGRPSSSSSRGSISLLWPSSTSTSETPWWWRWRPSSPWWSCLWCLRSYLVIERVQAFCKRAVHIEPPEKISISVQKAPKNTDCARFSSIQFWFARCYQSQMKYSWLKMVPLGQRKE